MKILISDGLAQKGIDLLSSVSEFEVEFRPGLSAAELKSAVSDTEALVIRSGTKVTADVIASASRLRVIGRAGIGLDNVHCGNEHPGRKCDYHGRTYRGHADGVVQEYPSGHHFHESGTMGEEKISRTGSLP
jgi:hypothetical protein